jgi:hypothetical protein
MSLFRMFVPARTLYRKSIAVNTTNIKMPRPYREGLITAFTDCLCLAADDGLHGRALRQALSDRITARVPRGYIDYCQRYQVPIGPRFSYVEWRTYAQDVKEHFQLCDMMETRPDVNHVVLRNMLALGENELPDVEDGEPGPDQLLRDGAVDAYMECAEYISLYSLDGAGFCGRVSQAILETWPPDYLEYRRRYMAFSEKDPNFVNLVDMLEYKDWCAAVDQLLAEIDRCQSQGRTPGRRHDKLRVRLLRVAGERAPNVD